MRNIGRTLRQATAWAALTLIATGCEDNPSSTESPIQEDHDHGKGGAHASPDAGPAGGTNAPANTAGRVAARWLHTWSSRCNSA